ncbi:MAG: LPS assembly lipoprotein LptE [Granulosicoccus sp.]
MSRTSYRALVLLLVAVCLSSCGFHPRGSVTRLTDLGSIYLDATRNLSIAESVREALVDAAFTLAPNRDEAGILLRLTGEEQNERVVSVNSTGRVSELELSHAVSMLIAETVAGESTSESQQQTFNRVEVIREYTYDETGVLGKENEARILRAEMEDELVRQIVLRTVARLAPSVTASSVYNTGRNLASLD